MRLEDLARELVRFTSGIVNGRTINIMNTQGIIIASTDENRIGNFHQGALDAVLSGQPVAIEPEEVGKYPGAKEGYNMPIRIEGEIIGVIGIFGKPAEIEMVARLLEEFAVKYYQYEALMVPAQRTAELKSRLLRNLLYPTAESRGNVRMLMQELHFDLTFPATLAVITEKEGPEDPAWGSRVSRLLQERGVIRPDRDLWDIEKHSMVILARGTDFPKKIQESGLLIPEGGYLVCIGDICRGQEEVARSFEQAMTLSMIATEGFSDIRDPDNRCRYLLHYIAEREEDYFDHYFEWLDQAFSPEELQTVLKSAAVYYHESHSVTKAAEKLFIHKNTLQYRIKKLESALNISEWPEFRKELLIRILMEGYVHKQGLKTLL